MSSGDLLVVHPSELKFPFEMKKQSSSSMQLTNKTNKHVAFKVKTTNPKKYCVRPNAGVVSPGSRCNITVTMQAQKEMPQDMQCKDKFLLQSVIAPDGVTTMKDLTPEMFIKEDGKIIGEFKLRVIYIPANPPSPVPEEPEEESPRSSSLPEDGKQDSSLLDTVSTALEVPKQKSSEAWSMISKLTEEKASALQDHQKLLKELELARKGKLNNTNVAVGGFSFLILAIVGLLGVFIGYFINNNT